MSVVLSNRPSRNYHRLALLSAPSPEEILIVQRWRDLLNSETISQDEFSALTPEARSFIRYHSIYVMLKHKKLILGHLSQLNNLICSRLDGHQLLFELYWYQYVDTQFVSGLSANALANFHDNARHLFQLFLNGKLKLDQWCSIDSDEKRDYFKNQNITLLTDQHLTFDQILALTPLQVRALENNNIAVLVKRQKLSLDDLGRLDEAGIAHFQDPQFATQCYINAKFLEQFLCAYRYPLFAGLRIK